MNSSKPSGEPSASAPTTPPSSTPPGRRGPAKKGRRGEKTVLTAHMPPPMPKHMHELIRSVADNLYRDPPMPPRYQALYEADARKKADEEDRS